MTIALNKSYNYQSYKTLMLEMAHSCETTGIRTDEHIAATLINAQRIKRIDKQCVLTEELKAVLNNVSNKMVWTVIVESWCGDGAQCIPVIGKMAEYCSNIELRFVFRDENLELMDSFLTNGSRSIPILICNDASTNNFIGKWGPRPQKIQLMVMEYKKENPQVSHNEFVEQLHLWYARDRTNSIQSDFLSLIPLWTKAK